MIDHLAGRVAGRYLSGLRQRRAMIEFSTKGTIDTAAVTEALKPMLGELQMLKFLPGLRGSPGAVRFEALTPRDELVQGQVFVHALVMDDAIYSWGEILLPPFYNLGARDPATGDPLRGRLPRVRQPTHFHPPTP